MKTDVSRNLAVRSSSNPSTANRPVMPMRLVFTFCLRFTTVAWLVCGVWHAHAADQFLDPEVAFKLHARAPDEYTIELTYTVAPGDYLHHEQFKFAAAGAALGAPVLPPGKAVGVFFLAGVLHPLTPCVLPMLLILSSLIAGQGARASRGCGLALAEGYSLAMATS